MTAATMKVWAAGTLAALERTNNGVETTEQRVASLEQQLNQAQHLLQVARQRVRDLERENEALRAGAGEVRYMRQADYARLTGLHPSTVSRRLRSGDLPGAVPPGGKVLHVVVDAR